MTATGTANGSLDFFVVEAAECLRQMDAILADAGDGRPDLEAFLRQARALRGSATMYRQVAISRVAAGLEKIGRSLRDGSLPWNAVLNTSIVSTLENIKILVRNTRLSNQSDAERGTPPYGGEPFASRTPSYTPSVRPDRDAAHLARASAALADALDHLVANPDDREALSVALGEARGLDGVAALHDHRPLAEVVHIAHRTAKSWELGAVPSSREVSLLAAAASALRRFALELGSARTIDPTAPEARRFQSALAALPETHLAEERIVPIEALFADDDSPSVLVAATTPPTTASERFRIEVVGHAEHLRRIVQEARSSRDPAGVERVARELRAALLALESAAASFGEQRVARVVAGWASRMFAVDGAALAALDSAAALLASGGSRHGDLAAELERFEHASVPAVGAPPPVPSTPGAESMYRLIEDGIAQLDRLSTEPLRDPSTIEEEQVVPMDDLLYRGRAALVRAAALRDEMRRQGGVPSPDAVAELFDLIDLALVD